MIIVANRTEKARMTGNVEIHTGIKFIVAMLPTKGFILLRQVLPQVASVSASYILVFDVCNDGRGTC
jgi:hypothetical protein